MNPSSRLQQANVGPTLVLLAQRWPELHRNQGCPNMRIPM